MHYVYIIQSISEPDQQFVGITANIKLQLSNHNAGKSKHTAEFAPWDLLTYTAFIDKRKAHKFEKYLKTRAGKSFTKKRLI